MAKAKNIETPEKMWLYYLEYKKETKANPFKVKDWVRDMEIMREKERPLTLEGFENWCSDNDIAQVLQQYFENREGRYSNYATVCKRIKANIRQDQIEGGMAGVYNPNITQRLNGLVDKQDIQMEQVESGSDESFANLDDGQLIVMAKVKRLKDQSINGIVNLDVLSIEEKIIYLRFNLSRTLK